jgi:hypothetical protein
LEWPQIIKGLPFFFTCPSDTSTLNSWKEIQEF